ncbi:MAG: hypothetical protein AVDCRST_MAG40-315, partial [uncultured Gemmatimonadaceae bacterium]
DHSCELDPPRDAGRRAGRAGRRRRVQLRREQPRAGGGAVPRQPGRGARDRQRRGARPVARAQLHRLRGRRGGARAVPRRLHRHLRRLRARADRPVRHRPEQRVLELRPARPLRGGARRQHDQGDARAGCLRQGRTRRAAQALGRLLQPAAGREHVRGRHQRRPARGVHRVPHARRAALHRGGGDRHGRGQRAVRQRRARRAGVGARGPGQLGGRGGRRRRDRRRLRLPDAVLHHRPRSVEPHLRGVGQHAVPRAHGVEHLLPAVLHHHPRPPHPVDAERRAAGGRRGGAHAGPRALVPADQVHEPHLAHQPVERVGDAPHRGRGQAHRRRRGRRDGAREQAPHRARAAALGRGRRRRGVDRAAARARDRALARGPAAQRPAPLGGRLAPRHAIGVRDAERDVLPRRRAQPVLPDPGFGAADESESEDAV